MCRLRGLYGSEVLTTPAATEICNHILAGEITEALRCIQEHIPRLLAPQTASSSGSGAMAVTTDDDDADSDSQSPPASPPGRGTALPAHMASERGAGSAGMSRKGSAASLAGGGAGNGAAGSAGSNGAGADGHGSLPPPPPFPYADSYDRPDFLKINLEIQQFVENLRHLVIPSSPSSSMASSMHSEAPGAGTGGSGSGGSKLQAAAVTNAMMTSNGGSGNLGLGASLASNGGGMGRDATVLHALAHAQSLHATAKRLRPAESRVYVQEIENACALLAYTDMEGSPLRGYLEQGRRTALAAQVNSAILGEPACVQEGAGALIHALSVHTGHAPHPMLEQVAKQTTFLWQTMADHGVPVAPPWTSAVEGPEWERLAAVRRHLGFALPLDRTNLGRAVPRTVLPLPPQIRPVRLCRRPLTDGVVLTVTEDYFHTDFPGCSHFTPHGPASLRHSILYDRSDPLYLETRP